MIDWEQYPNFSADEFTCSHCGKEGINETLIVVLQIIRHEVSFPFIITSGFRCAEHPIEKKKDKLGVHTTGLAVDIGCSGGQAHTILRLAMERNLSGIGINQKGDGRFIHIDISEAQENRPRPWIWSY